MTGLLRLAGLNEGKKPLWASHVDMATGRPVETENADHYSKSQVTGPAPSGGHNWQPMAFNAQTGLDFIPAMENTHTYNTSKEFTYLKGPHWNMGQSESQQKTKALHQYCR